MRNIVVGTTTAAFAMSKDPRAWSNWLAPLDLPNSGNVRLHYFAALEVDRRGLEPFSALERRLFAMGGAFRARGVFWSYSLDDGRTEVTSHNRVRHIVTGRNLIVDYAMEVDASHILFLDADTAPPPDALVRLLELDYPVVGGHVPTYCLDGRKVKLSELGPGKIPPGADVREHMNTAGFLLVEVGTVFDRAGIRWRHVPRLGWTDDPAFHHDCVDAGYPTWVRHDVVGTHYPQQLPALERRGYDRSVHW